MNLVKRTSRSNQRIGDEHLFLTRREGKKGKLFVKDCADRQYDGRWGKNDFAKPSTLLMSGAVDTKAEPHRESLSGNLGPVLNL